MDRPKPFRMGRVLVRVHSGPRKEDGRWRWRADRSDGVKDGKEIRTPIWSGWGDRDEAEKKVLEVLVERGERWHSAEDVKTVGDLLSVWIADLAPHDRSGYTSRARKGCADRISELPIASARLDRLDRRTLENYVRGHVGAASTLRSDMISLRAAWAWGRERNLVPDQDLPRITVRKGDPVYSRYTPTPLEVAKVIVELRRQPPTRPRDWPFRAVYLLFASGCRPGEIASLKWDNVDLVRHVLYVDGKMGARAVTLHPTVCEEMATWTHHGATVCGCAPASIKGHLHTRIERACETAGLRRWSLYGLRRAAVAVLYGSGEDPSVAAKMLGHSVQTAMTAYRQVAEKDMAAAVERTGLGLLPGLDAEIKRVSAAGGGASDNVVDFRTRKPRGGT